MKDVIETLKFIYEAQKMPMYKIDGSKVRFMLHVPSHCETLFGDDDTGRIQTKLLEFGFVQTRRIDCRDRSEDRSETIIYHYEFNFESSLEGNKFLADWEKNPFYKYDVLKKYGIHT